MLSDQEKWEKLLQVLDDKSQLGLLNSMSRVTEYKFEGAILMICPLNKEDLAYLSKTSSKHQIMILAEGICEIKSVEIFSSSNESK